MRAEFEHDLADFDDPNKSDRGAFVRFFMQPVMNEQKSAQEGRPIYDDKEYCEIIVPGNKTNVPIKPVNDIVKRRFAVQYRQWKATGDSNHLSGTPLVEITWLTRSRVEELAYYNIRTLEQLASVSDEVCTKLMGIYDLRRKAQAHVEAAKNAAPIELLQKRLDEKDAQIAALENELKEQAETIKDLRKDRKG